MAKTSKKETSEPKSNDGTPKTPWKLNRRNKVLFGALLVLFAVALLLSFVSYYIYGEYDQSALGSFADRSEKTYNWLGKFGAYLSDFFLYKGFGVSSFLLVRLFFLAGAYLLVDISLAKLKSSIFWDMFAMVIISILCGFFWNYIPQLGGVIGYEMNLFAQDYIGKTGTFLALLFGVIVYLILKIKISTEGIKNFFESRSRSFEEELNEGKEVTENNINTPTPLVTDINDSNDFIEEVEVPTSNPSLDFNDAEDDEILSNIELKTVPSAFEINKDALKPTIEHPSEITLKPVPPVAVPHILDTVTPVVPETSKSEIIHTDDDSFTIEKIEEETTVEENLAARLVQDFGEFDPTLELSNYQFPSIDLLKEYSSGGITINQAELEENKNRIVDTLKNYNIGISQIKATVGPTVTLYEIVPEAGIRISKIKNLEDDIALSLAALGIRIIAPIPGKGTIGIEVPNNNPTMVSMKSVIASPKFQTAEMELPIALGKTISNETFVVDLAKMPHLLMAGATGQGKSVGLNAVLTSILYKKHPAEVKFVLVDPKKVELTLFNKIERHYLAKLPDDGDAIITDNTKVIYTLNSLCIEMDNRYSLLKDAMVRNIKEYNEKFKQRKLNPENGHRFLPYIVLVVDEFADLIMTAGKEVETPIARLAQLARAIGIHLIIATQRPSVNVITGMIKANFPARIAFRVTSKIDSRTILDTGGADQLIGRGDLLYTQGNDIVRVQCAFVDTPEVEKITEYIGSQKAYPNAYLLPEYVGEESGISLDIDISERDSMFREAAEIIVTAQQGSASLLQRKLKLGYNRAGRLIDQLEAAGIVGPFEGSKARSVNIPDLVALEHFLASEQNNM
ncbi:cell division protein [Flavobacterium enshiense DK69]|uniref:Cell division protein FtsK n=1 Tax=Flavobacterium enshiense DK69 TaxID=1107311 RepID=V6SEN9_9FLAO|nr:DNA translocase FtsK [Flavobacterium enshiense]ESU24707.1 cell division protein [Flavobacterium enshiense DK69]KGO96834.1 cell division protein FtsK [Flavobacterium enshiense DK69]